MKIEKLPSGTYRARVSYKDSQGKYRRKSITGKTREIVRRKVAEFEFTADNPTVQTMLDGFIAAKEPVLSPSTIAGYKSLASTLSNKHGSFCAQADIDKPTAQHLVNELSRSHTPKTVRNYVALLSAAFRFYDRAFPHVSLPQRERPQIQIPDEDTVRLILKLAEGPRMEIPVRLATYGLRRSEICALTSDDLVGNRIHVHKAAVQDEYGAVIIKTTKTYTSNRWVTIDDELAALIREGMPKLTPMAFSKAWNRLLSSNGLPHYRLHDLRHFFVSYCKTVLKLSDPQIQAITGHKTTFTMQNYVHAMHQDEAAELVSKSLSDFVSK